MINTIHDLKLQYKSYSDINGKIRREIRDGKYIPIIRGLYETDRTTPGYYLSAYIYGPSYLSFDYALSYYGMIPERVTSYTLATYNKQKTKKYITPFGTYIYRDIPNSAYPFDIFAIEENNYVYYIASREKAICDKLYSSKPVASVKQLKEMIFEDLRIDSDAFFSLDIEKLGMLIPKYKSKNLMLLLKLIKGESYTHIIRGEK
jgi:predicted transcriptional regulator of viral defense system